MLSLLVTTQKFNVCFVEKRLKVIDADTHEEDQKHFFFLKVQIQIQYGPAESHDTN